MSKNYRILKDIDMKATVVVEVIIIVVVGAILVEEDIIIKVVEAQGNFSIFWREKI